MIISGVSKVKLKPTRQYRLVPTAVPGLFGKLTGHLRVTCFSKCAFRSYGTVDNPQIWLYQERTATYTL